MMRTLSLLGCFLMPVAGPASVEFTVLVYNVENLFDLDGVALFEDYEQDGDSGYGVEPLLNKVEGIRRILASINSGEGPEVILFQEFELDRTPFDTPDPEAFLQETAGRSLEALLREESSAANLPAELLLLKYLEENGLRGYRIAQPDPFQMEGHKPHKNVLFTRFPVTFIRQRPSLEARDLLVVGLSIAGHELVLMNNHWKSGASNPDTESIRVQNARVVRAELEALLYGNPQRDVIIAGDLNSYYNQKAVFPELKETAVNDVLRANGFENRMILPGSQNLYNLWFELPPEERGSEVYRGYWGTLMQMVLTPGLYDGTGIQYIDNSFGRLAIPRENVDTRWGRPVRWTNYGGGGGYSDHLPIYARFRTVDESHGKEKFDSLTREALSGYREPVAYGRLNRKAIPPLEVLAGMSETEQLESLGELFQLDLPLASNRPPTVLAGDLELEVYSPVREIREALSRMKPGDPLEAIADLGAYRGKLQVVIREPSWFQE